MKITNAEAASLVEELKRLTTIVMRHKDSVASSETKGEEKVSASSASAIKKVTKFSIKSDRGDEFKDRITGEKNDSVG